MYYYLSLNKDINYDNEPETCLKDPKWNLKYSETNFIYEGSDINLQEFALSFLICTKKLNISDSSKNHLYDYLKTILPSTNKLPRSYGQLIKNLSIDSVVQKKLCKNCDTEIINSICKKCLINKRNIQKNYNSIYTFNAIEQIKSIITKNWFIIKEYKSKI